MEHETAIELVSKITEFNDLSVHMNDPDLDIALGYVVKLVANPEVPVFKVPNLIVKLQAIAAQCQTKGKYLQTFGSGVTPEERKLAADKKNVYYTVSAELDKLVNTLKYYAK
jgi:predicted aconitase